MRDITFIMLLFLGTVLYGQQQIVFVVDSNMVDNIRFSAKNKYAPIDFYTEKQLSIDKSEDGKYYSLTITEPSVILVTMPPEIRLFHEVYLSVEDTIHISKSNTGDWLLFSGKNRITNSQYNYHNEEQQWQKENRPPFYKAGTDLAEHKEIVGKWIEKKREYFHNYFNKKDVQEEFKVFFDTRTDCEYTFRLLLPLRSGISNFPENYMDGTIRGNYNSRLFVVASPLYIEWFREIKNYDLTKMKNYIELQFNGDTREYLLSLMMGIYADGEHVDSTVFLQYADYFARHFKQRDYIEYIEDAKDYFLKSLTPIPDTVLINTIVETMDSENLTFHSLLEEHKGRYIILDFWASWCGPCIKDIKESAEIKKLLSQNDVAYVYVSVDQDRDKWISTSTELGITDLQFRIIDNRSSPLLDYLQVSGIPRYIFFNRESSLINMNGRSPLSEHAEYFKSAFSK